MPSAKSPEITYREALRRLLGLADMERMAGLAAPTVKYDLRRMAELAARLNLIEGGPKIVHVAGTKGKGSVAAMIASILQSHGLRTGLYTSPHLHSFRERIRLCGDPVSEGKFAASVERVWHEVEAMAGTPAGRPSTFEVLTAMALETFRRESVDFAVLEVGLGGRLDATNVFESDVAVITSVSYDHTAILGETLAEIAAEKAGVIKRPQPVVSAPQRPEARHVIEARSVEMKAALIVVGEDVWFQQTGHDLSGQSVEIQTAAARYEARVPLLGAHQAENAAVAVAAVEQAGVVIDPLAVSLGFSRVHWDGRFQVLARQPYVVVDGAHNAYSMGRLAETLHEYLPAARVHLIFGASADKQLEEMANEAASFSSDIRTVSSRHPRALSPTKLRDTFAGLGVQVTKSSSIADAMRSAISDAEQEDVVLVTGSLFVVAEALEWYLGIPGEHYAEFESHSVAVASLPG